jgi:hypothetical protein
MGGIPLWPKVYGGFGFDVMDPQAGLADLTSGGRGENDSNGGEGGRDGDDIQGVSEVGSQTDTEESDRSEYVRDRDNWEDPFSKPLSRQEYDVYVIW